MHPPSPLRLLLAGALLVAACTPTAVSQQPAAPAAALPAPRSPAPASITAGAMPGDADVYVGFRDFPTVLGAARSIAGEARFDGALAEANAKMGMPKGSIERFLAAIESVHLGGKAVDDGLSFALSIVLRDAQPMRDILASGAVVDSGPFGTHGRRLRSRMGQRDTLVWFEGQRLLLAGERPMKAAVHAVIAGRIPGLDPARLGVPSAAARGRRVIDALVGGQVLAGLTGGALSFPAPVTASFDLGEDGLHGVYRGSVALPRFAADLAPPPPRPLTLARRLPAETLAYAAISTRMPGGRQDIARLLMLIAASSRKARGTIGDIDDALDHIGLGVTDVLGAFGDEGIIAVVGRPGVSSLAELKSDFAVAYVVEVADPRPLEQALSWVRSLPPPRPGSGLRMHLESNGISMEFPSPVVPLMRVRVERGLLLLAGGQRDLVERATRAIERGERTLGDDEMHRRALALVPPSAQARAWFDFSRFFMLGAGEVPPEGRPFVNVLTEALGRHRPLSCALSVTGVSEQGELRLEVEDINNVFPWIWLMEQALGRLSE